MYKLKQKESTYRVITSTYYLLLSFIFLYLNNNLSAQSWNFNSLTVDEGLSQNSVIDITQDSLGFLWLATQDGLNQLDGTNIIPHEKYFIDRTDTESFRLGRLYTSLRDKLWMTNINGDLSYFEKDRTIISTIPEIKEGSCIFQEKNQRIWIGTFGNGLFWIDETSELKLVEGTQDWKIHFITSFEEGTLYIGTEKGIYTILSETYFPKAKLVFPSLQEKNISCITQKDDLLYIGTYGDGLFIANQNGSLQQLDDLPNTSKVLDVLADSKGRIWIATYGDGAYLLEYNSLIQHFTFSPKNNFSINYNDVLCLFEDRDGTIWLGTDGGGVSYFKQENNQFYGLSKNQVPNNIAVDVVRSISTDENGVIWIGTSGKGLTSYDPQTKLFQTYTTASSALASNRIMSLWHDSLNQLYIGTQDAGLIVRNLEGKFQNLPNLPGKTVWSIHSQNPDELWLCTRTQGLIRWNSQKNTFQQFQYAANNVHSIASNNIRVIEPYKANSFFIGTQERGVQLFDRPKEQFKTILLGEDFTPANIGAIKDLYYKDSILWIGTQRAGLLAYNLNTQSTIQYHQRRGLPNNVVYSILEDKEKYFWISTNKGICQIDPQKILSEQYKQVLLTHFTKQNGLVSNEFNTGASYKTKDGTLFFGGLDGVNWFQPQSLLQKNSTTPIAFLKLIYNNQQTVKTISLLDKTSVDLAYFNDNFQVHFSALSFPKTENIVYEYKLVGYQDNWLNNQNSGIATFSNIPSGTYELLVRSRSTQAEPSTSYRLKIHIQTPWYKSIWAYLMYGLAIGFILYGIYRFQRNRWQLQTALQLEKQESRRLQELDAFKTQVFTNISHEIRTPLTVIRGMSQEIESTNRKNVILRNTDYLLDLTNNILDLSKLEAGLLKADYIQDDIINYLRVLCESFDSYAKYKNIQLQFDTSISHLKMDFDREKIRQLISNLISNAIKFTPADGQIWMDVNATHQQLMIHVKDTGVGIPKDELPHIFKRFHQTNTPQKNTIGSGIGLALVKELIQLFEGTIHVESELHKGTSFSIRLPISNNALPDKTSVSLQMLVPPDEPVESDFSPNNEETCSILIVEDNIDVANYIASCIANDYHYKIATNGQEGLNYALEQIPDLIISDVMMPEMDGYELCSILKKEEKTNHIPIVLLTAKASQAAKIEGIEQGADVYLVKPFEEKELMIQIERLIQLRQVLQKKYQQEFSNTSITPSAPTPTLDPFLLKINTVLDENLTAEEFSIPFLCQQLALSRMQLHRKLKALTDQSTTQYITNYRLQKALPLLRQKELTISEIAYQVGFNDPNYFTRCFVKAYGVPPSEVSQ